MPKMMSQLTLSEYEDLTRLWDLETLLTRNAHVLSLNLPSREKLVKEIRDAIKKIEEV